MKNFEVKQFLKPDRSKILITIVFLILLLLASLFTSCYAQTVGEPKFYYPILCTLLDKAGGTIADETIVILMGPGFIKGREIFLNLYSLVLLLIGYYILACFVVIIYRRIKGSRGIKR